MLKLIWQNLRYCTFGKVFLFGAAIQVFIVFMSIKDGFYFIQSAPMIAGMFVSCAVVVINTAIEMESGAYRNKIISGYKRWQIFFAQVISSAVCGGVMFAIVGVPLYVKCAVPEIYYTAVIALAAYVALAVICACAVMCFSHINKAGAAILVLFFACVAMAYPMQDMLAEVQYDVDCTVQEVTHADGSHEVVETMKQSRNPMYLGGVPRVIVKSASYINPFSQMLYIDQLIAHVQNIYIDATLNFEHGPDATQEEIDNHRSEIINRWQTICEYDGDLSGDAANAYGDDISNDIINENWSFPLISLGTAAVFMVVGMLVFGKRNLL